MTTDFRTLCAELLDELEYHTDWSIAESLKAKARAALADKPAVPEGREPVAGNGQPSDQEGPSAEDVKELCEEHCFNVEGYESIECLQGLINEAIARWGNAAPVPPARLRNCPTHGQQPPEAWGCPECVMELRKELTALRQQQPQPPADGEVAELVALLRAEAKDDMLTLTPADLLLAAELLQRQALVPVSVSDGWPEFSDCDDADRVWCWSWAIGTWRLSRINRSIHTHWLPAHALPLPEVSNG